MKKIKDLENFDIDNETNWGNESYNFSVRDVTIRSTDIACALNEFIDRRIGGLYDNQDSSPTEDFSVDLTDLHTFFHARMGNERVTMYEMDSNLDIDEQLENIIRLSAETSYWGEDFIKLEIPEHLASESRRLICGMGPNGRVNMRFYDGRQYTIHFTLSNTNSDYIVVRLS